MKALGWTSIAALLVAVGLPVHGAADDGEANFRALYKELVETNTTSRRAAARWPPSAWPRA